MRQKENKRLSGAQRPSLFDAHPLTEKDDVGKGTRESRGEEGGIREERSRRAMPSKRVISFLSRRRGVTARGRGKTIGGP